MPRASEGHAYGKMERLVAPEGVGIEEAAARSGIGQMEPESPIESEGDEPQVVAEADAGVDGNVGAYVFEAELSAVKGAQQLDKLIGGGFDVDV